MKKLSDHLNHDYAPGGLLRSAKQNPAVMMSVASLGRYRRPPLWLIGVVAIAILASFVPIAWAFQARFAKSTQPRVHLFQDMDNQPKYKAQSASPVFDDGRAARFPIPGTVARGEFIEHDGYALGWYPDQSDTAAGDEAAVTWVTDMTAEVGDQVVFDRKLLDRGQELYNRFCWLCHGYDGYGNGPVHVRARKLGGAAGAWVQPSNLHDETRRDRPDGHLYKTVSVGIRNMAGYGQQIRDPNDRWAVVAYVRALQLAGNAPIDQVPADLRGQLADVTPPLVNGQPPLDPEDEEQQDGAAVEAGPQAAAGN